MAGHRPDNVARIYFFNGGEGVQQGRVVNQAATEKNRSAPALTMGLRE